jgi:excisionase family DNA binding protein
VREELLTPPEVATWLQVPLSTLRIWRHRGEGPPALKVGRVLRYRQQDIETWLEACRREAAGRAR